MKSIGKVFHFLCILSFFSLTAFGPSTAMAVNASLMSTKWGYVRLRPEQPGDPTGDTSRSLWWPPFPGQLL